MAAQGWRLPRGFRKSGIAANTSMSGRGCAIIRLHLGRGLWLRWGMPGQQSPTLNTTLYRLWEPVMQCLYFDCLHRRLRTVVYVSLMEPIGYDVSSDRNGPTRYVASASVFPPTYATSSHTETPRVRSSRGLGVSAVTSWPVSIFFPRCVSRSRNHVASNESV